MPTRKQRRRREKEHRHEYEFVTYDDEGHEIPVDPAELKPAKTDRASNGKPAPKGKGTQAKDRRGRPLREVKPPSWRASVKRAAIFVVVLGVFLSFTNKHQSTAVKIGLPLVYGLIGVPFFYWMDRSAYRRYLRATGREDEIPATPRRGSRR